MKLHKKARNATCLQIVSLCKLSMRITYHVIIHALSTEVFILRVIKHGSYARSSYVTEVKDLKSCRTGYWSQLTSFTIIPCITAKMFHIFVCHKLHTCTTQSETFIKKQTYTDDPTAILTCTKLLSISWLLVKYISGSCEISVVSRRYLSCGPWNCARTDWTGSENHLI